MINIKVYYLKIFSFLEVKFSIYLNTRVFVMLIMFQTSKIENSICDTTYASLCNIQPMFAYNI